MPNLTTTVTKMDGGVATVAGVGLDWLFTVAGTWATGEKITLIFTDATTAVQTQVGAGDVTGLVPTFAYTYDDKVYVLAGRTAYFSAIGEPTVWNDLNGIGNGNVTMSNFYATPGDLVAIGHFQGKLAFLGRQTTQLFQVNANPDLWQKTQTFDNVGTFAADSVKSVGDMDLLFLSDTGIRSLRVKDVSANAYVDDVGTPIDAYIQTQMLALSDAAKAAACAIVEPTSNRYWLFLGDKIYVLSMFQSSKVQAWSIYNPTYANVINVQTAFTPTKFVTYNGQVFCRDADAIYAYGGADKNTYDNVVAAFELPWTEVKQPATRKQADGLDAIFTGAWTIEVGMDPQGGALTTVLDDASSDTIKTNQRIPYSDNGTHFKIHAETTGSTAALFSSLILHFQAGDEK